MKEPHQDEYWLSNYQPLTEQECREMAAGRVPEWLRNVCRSMVEWSLESGDVSYLGLAEQRQRAQALANKIREVGEQQPRRKKSA